MVHTGWTWKHYIDMQSKKGDATLKEVAHGCQKVLIVHLAILGTTVIFAQRARKHSPFSLVMDFHRLLLNSPHRKITSRFRFNFSQLQSDSIMPRLTRQQNINSRKSNGLEHVHIWSVRQNGALTRKPIVGKTYLLRHWLIRLLRFLTQGYSDLKDHGSACSSTLYWAARVLVMYQRGQIQISDWWRNCDGLIGGNMWYPHFHRL